MIRKGQQIHIKPEWQDAGDQNFTWYAIEDESFGLLRIRPIGGEIRSVMSVQTFMLEESSKLAVDQR